MTDRDDQEVDAGPKLKITTDIQSVSACERRIKITVPREEVDRYFEAEFVELRKTAYVPGFRVGNAPKKLVEKRFRKDISERIKNALVSDSIREINETTELTPIGEPELDYASLVLPEDGPFVFEFSIEVRPDFEMPNWKGLKIKKPVREFTETDVDSAAERLLASSGSLEPSDSPAERGDYIETTLTFKSEGQILSPPTNETIRIRSVLSFHDGSIKDFDKLMIGAKPGDVIEAKTILTNDAPNAKYRGKTIDAVFEIADVKKLCLPTLSEAFLERLGGFSSVGDFRDKVLDNLKRQLDHEQGQQTRRQIIESLTVAASWDLPPTLLAKQSERELDRAVLEMKRNGYSDADIRFHLNRLRQNSAAETTRALKEHFILEKIAEVENIEDTEQDYHDEIALIAAQNNVTPRKVRAHIEKMGQMDILRNQIIERKVIALILENAVFTEIPFQFEDNDVEAIDRAAAGDPNAIAQVSEEDLKAVHKEMDAKKKIDPNVKIT